MQQITNSAQQFLKLCKSNQKCATVVENEQTIFKVLESGQKCAKVTNSEETVATSVHHLLKVQKKQK